MALDKDQWDTVNEAMRTLRGLGCAVCVFTPDDVESVGEGDEDAPIITPEHASAWMADNRKQLEDAMANVGNVIISTNVPADVTAEA